MREYKCLVDLVIHVFIPTNTSNGMNLNNVCHAYDTSIDKHETIYVHKVKLTQVNKARTEY